MFPFKKDIHSFSDEALMELLASKRSNEALTELHARYSKKVLGFFIRMYQGDVDRAQDMTQELFLRILEKHHLFDTSKKFYTWMFTIASNMCKTSFRMKVHERIEEGNSHFDQQFDWGDNELDKELFRETLKQAVADLEEYHRLTFVLRYMEELSVKEIAVITDVSVGTVKSRLFYATRKITKSLNEFDPQEQGQLFKLS